MLSLPIPIVIVIEVKYKLFLISLLPHMPCSSAQLTAHYSSYFSLAVNEVQLSCKCLSVHDVKETCR